MRKTVHERPSYEDAQRPPNDHEIFTSQRPIAIHSLEHLAETDRCTVMHRNLIRNGIRAVQEGRDPHGIFREADGSIPTFSSSHIKSISLASSDGEDRGILRHTAQEWLHHCPKNPPSNAVQMISRTSYLPTTHRGYKVDHHLKQIRHNTFYMCRAPIS